MKNRVTILFSKLKALHKILMRIRRSIYNPFFFLYFQFPFMTVGSRRSNSACFTTKFPSFQTYQTQILKEGGGLPLIPEHFAQSGTQYLSSKNIYYVKLNSQSQHRVNEADTKINHQSLIKSLLRRSMSNSHNIQENFIGKMCLVASTMTSFLNIRKSPGKVVMVKLLLTLFPPHYIWHQTSGVGYNSLCMVYSTR